MTAKEKPRPAGPPPYRPTQKSEAAAPGRKGPAAPAAYRPQTPAAAPKSARNQKP